MLHSDTICVSDMANTSYDLTHKKSFIYFVDSDKEKTASRDVARGH